MNSEQYKEEKGFRRKLFFEKIFYLSLDLIKKTAII